MSESVILTANIADYFHEIIDTAIRAQKVEATPAASSYLVALLVDYAHPTVEVEQTFDKPLTFVLRDALEATGKERFRRLRSLGDHVLYALGFFGEHIETKGVDKRYVMGLGTTAYGEAAAMLRRNARQAELGPDVLSELAQKFKPFTAVLADVAEGTLVCGARDERSLVKLYERWMKTGSSRIADELGTLGIIPTRGAGGMN